VPKGAEAFGRHPSPKVRALLKDIDNTSDAILQNVK
jgi:hypothetical protein